MSWKKNVFSYLLWVLYAVAAEVGLVCLADALCDSMGVKIYIGTVACALYIVAAGLGVYLVHRFVSKYSVTDKNESKHSASTVTGAAVTVFLLVIGLVLRVRGMGDTAAGNTYYELAAMVSEERIPWFDHGAVRLYIGMLHRLFYFLGNKPTVAVWVQILLQLSAMLLLYFAVRQTAGNIAAIVMLGFGMFSSYLIKETSDLSPDMLYLLFWAAALLLTVTAARVKKSLWGFAAAGFVISLVSYLDVAGCLLLLLSMAFIFCSGEEKSEAGRKMKCLLFCLMGAGVGFAGCVLVDCLMSGKTFAGALAGWFQLYRPLGFRLPVSADVPEKMTSAMVEYLILFCVLTLGIFSFWRNRQSDNRKAWILLVIVLVPAGCFGIFTEEMPMGLYMYLLLTIMAGIAVEECVCKVKPMTGSAALKPVEAASQVETAVQVGAAAQVEPTSRGKLTSRVELTAAPRQDRKDTSQTHGQADTNRESTLPQNGKADAAPQTDGEAAPQPKKVKLIENPLPLPKKHVRKKLDYGVSVPEGKDDFDLEVDEKDDFDI